MEISTNFCFCVEKQIFEPKYFSIIFKNVIENLIFSESMMSVNFKFKFLSKNEPGASKKSLRVVSNDVNK